MQFEWDENKARKNLKTHGISFETAALVFNDDQRIEYFDEIHSEKEDRYITIGFVGEILMVVYTVRRQKYRIISARIATDKEKRRYHDGY